MDDLERKAVFLSTLHHLRQTIGAEPDEFASMLVETAMLLAPQLFNMGEDDEDDMPEPATEVRQ
ncbi:hypothetical protein [Xanthobacter agilis]|uniref:Uncharacterized protein n=1 Tax=Xanthobacter agilis TaxID=47492 RepID=A0ABU0LFN7_XANAG|nr:hypothetical protein [Xanthobacter agilis]MDQ0505955.1 hypothetical protein [Xanthobacter agilis]